MGASKLNTLNQLSLLWPGVAKHPSSELRPAASFPEVHHYIYSLVVIFDGNYISFLIVFSYPCFTFMGYELVSPRRLYLSLMNGTVAIHQT